MTTPQRDITPLPHSVVRARPPYLIFYGGVFDPPHRAHVDLPVRARDSLPGAWLLYVPAARSPHKDATPRAGDADRVEMLSLALEGVDRAAIWTDEIDRAGGAAGGAPSYTVDTLVRLRTVVNWETTPRLLIGADQAAVFHEWHRFRDILAEAEPLVMVRAPAASAADLMRRMRQSGAWSGPELESWHRRITPVRAFEASSSTIRSLVRSSPDHPELEGLLHPRVREYIRARRLYGQSGTGDRSTDQLP